MGRALRSRLPASRLTICEAVCGPSVFGSLDSRIEAVSPVENKLKEQSAPRGVILQIVVKLRRHGAQLRQIVPRDRRQIVVLIVITHVQRHQIDRPIVTERLLVEVVSVMLLNPACPHRVQPNGKQKREHQIKKSSPTAEINDCDIVRSCAYKIDGEPAVPHLDRFESRRTRYLKKWKQHQPNRFSCLMSCP